MINLTQEQVDRFKGIMDSLKSDKKGSIVNVSINGVEKEFRAGPVSKLVMILVKKGIL